MTTGHLRSRAISAFFAIHFIVLNQFMNVVRVNYDDNCTADNKRRRARQKSVNDVNEIGNRRKNPQD
jgi:hypothetical protein